MVSGLPWTIIQPPTFSVTQVACFFTILPCVLQRQDDFFRGCNERLLSVRLLYFHQDRSRPGPTNELPHFRRKFFKNLTWAKDFENATDKNMTILELIREDIDIPATLFAKNVSGVLVNQNYGIPAWLLGWIQFRFVVYSFQRIFRPKILRRLKCLKKSGDLKCMCYVLILFPNRFGLYFWKDRS